MSPHHRASLAALACVALAAHAATIHVNGTTGNDAWDGLCEVWDGNTCGPKLTIAAGIAAAQPGDEVVIADGIYTGPGNKNLDFAGKAITVRSASGHSDRCVIDCAGSGFGFYFHSGETSASIVRGMTIRGGSDGGIVCVSSSNPTVIQSAITHNTSSFEGGGLYCEVSAPTFVECSVTHNSTSFWSGGGGGVFCSASSPTFIRCVISENTAISTSGGGVYCELSPGATFSTCEISGNSAAGVGGGIYFGNATGVLLDCIIANNTAGTGGGLYAAFSTSTLTACRIIGNTARFAGGMQVSYEQATLTGCIIADNQGELHTGGALFNECAVSLTNCTITRNTAGDGGGLSSYTYAMVTLANCIVQDNAPETIYISSGTVHVTYSNVQGGWPGAGNTSVDPLFRDSDGVDNDPAACGDNDYRLASGSPCIDAGYNAAVPSDTLFDLAGRARFVDDPLTPDTGSGTPPIVDMGAYEYQLDGDCDLNWAIDLDDYNALAECMLGPDRLLELGCGCGDLDIDADIDLADFTMLQTSFTGP